MILLWVALCIILVFGIMAFLGAPYVPSHRGEIKKAFTKLYMLTEKDTVVDLGSGDGVVLRQAIMNGAGRAVGYELNPFLVMLSRVLTRNKQTTIMMSDIWRLHPPRDVTLVYIFTVGRDTKKVASLMQKWATELSRPLSLIIYGNTLPDLPPRQTLGAHHLYEFYPLQQQKPQV